MPAEWEWIVAEALIVLDPLGPESAGQWNYSKRNLTSRFGRPAEKLETGSAPS